MKGVPKKAKLVSPAAQSLTSHALTLRSIALGLTSDPTVWAGEALVVWLNGKQTLEQWAAEGDPREGRGEQVAAFRRANPEATTDVEIEGHTQESKERVQELVRAIQRELQYWATFKIKHDRRVLAETQQGKLADARLRVVESLLSRVREQIAAAGASQGEQEKLEFQLQELAVERDELLMKIAVGHRARERDDSSTIISGGTARLMQKYAAYPTLFFYPRTGFIGLALQPEATGGHPYDMWRMLESVSTMSDADWPSIMPAPPVPIGEVLAAHAVLELARLGVLDRVRECLCGRWFFAKRADRIHHSTACRHKLYEQTPAFKVKRKAYAADYYEKTIKRGVGAGARKRKPSKSTTVQPGK